MLSEKTKKRIKDHKWSEHSNKSQFFIRVKNQCTEAISDLTLAVEHLDQNQLQEIFTKEKLEPFIKSLMRPDLVHKNYKPTKEERDRIFALGCMFLDWSLNTTRSYIDNLLIQEKFGEYEGPLREMLPLLYEERFGKTL